MEKQEILANLHYMPVFLFVTLPTTFILTYVIAVLLGHVEAGFPYISDAATYAPESCIFAQFINMTAALSKYLLYLLYNIVFQESTVYRLNRDISQVSAYLGITVS